MTDAHCMEFDMTIVTKWASIATAAIVEISLGMPLPVPAFADPAQCRNSGQINSAKASRKSDFCCGYSYDHIVVGLRFRAKRQGARL